MGTEKEFTNKQTRENRQVLSDLRNLVIYCYENRNEEQLDLVKVSELARSARDCLAKIERALSAIHTRVGEISDHTIKDELNYYLQHVTEKKLKGEE